MAGFSKSKPPVKLAKLPKQSVKFQIQKKLSPKNRLQLQNKNSIQKHSLVQNMPKLHLEKKAKLQNKPTLLKKLKFQQKPQFQQQVQKLGRNKKGKAAVLSDISLKAQMEKLSSEKQVREILAQKQAGKQQPPEQKQSSSGAPCDSGAAPVRASSVRKSSSVQKYNRSPSAKKMRFK